MLRPVSAAADTPGHLPPMRCHLVQMEIAWEDPPANHQRVRDLLTGTTLRRNDLVILPEMFDTGFSFNLDRTCDAEGRTLRFLSHLGATLGVYVHGSRTVRGPDGRGRNRATIIDSEGRVIAEYDKIHPFTYGKEAEYFTGGGEVVTYAWAAGEARTTVCAAICYDLRFPELFRRGLLLGAEVYALGANWPRPRAFHRRALAVARAIENQAFVACVNRCGHDPNAEYDGASVVLGPRGEVLGELDDRESVLSVELDLGALREWRDRFPAWRDHRLLGGDPHRK